MDGPKHRKLTRRLRVAKLRYSSSWKTSTSNIVASGPFPSPRSGLGTGTIEFPVRPMGKVFWLFRRTSLPARFQCRLRNAPSCTNWRSAVATAPTLVFWHGWPRPISHRRLALPRYAMPNAGTIEVVEESAINLPVADWHGVIATRTRSTPSAIASSTTRIAS